jgi:hypothetical protein
MVPTAACPAVLPLDTQQSQQQNEMLPGGKQKKKKTLLSQTAGRGPRLQEAPSVS